MNSFRMRINGMNLANSVIPVNANNEENVMKDSLICFDTSSGINYYQMLIQRSALKLEIAGLKHSSGRSVYSYIKRVYALKGNKKLVLQQFTELIEKQHGLKKGTLK